MIGKWYTDEFKIEAVRQLTERRHLVRDGRSSAVHRTVGNRRRDI